VPFLIPSGDNFRFTFWDGEHTLDDDASWFWYALVAKVLIFVRIRRGPATFFFGAAAVLFFTLVEKDKISIDHRAGALIAVGTFAGAIALRLLASRATERGAKRAARARHLSRMAWLVVLYSAYFYSIRVSLEVRQTADCLFGALVLSAEFVSRVREGRVPRDGHVFLLLLGVLAAGWVGLAWTTHRLEWTFLEELAPGARLDRLLVLLSPLILGRYVIPVLVARMLVDERFAEPAARGAFRVMGVKVLGLAAVFAGLAYVNAVSNVYLEAVEECAIFFLLMSGLAAPAFWQVRERARLRT
jgi:hypothetical protein